MKSRSVIGPQEPKGSLNSDLDSGRPYKYFRPLLLLPSQLVHLSLPSPPTPPFPPFQMSTQIITETSTYTSLCLSPVPLPLALTLPNELWLQVLRSAVSTKEWREDVFFPPKIDFSLVDGFRQTCHLFHDLSVSLYQSMRGRNVTVNDAFELLRPSFPLERTK